MPSSKLLWYPDRGFELDLDVGDDEVTLRMVAIPVPAEGTDELEADGVELHKLEVLFKGQAEIEGEPGQIQSARVRIEGGELHIDVSIEDMETGEIVRWSADVRVQIPAGAPRTGGPRPPAPEEDDLDWEDETTLERLIVDAPSASPTPTRREGGRDGGKAAKDARPVAGIQRLIQALKELDDPSGELDDDDDASDEEEKAKTENRPPAPSSRPPAPMGRNPVPVLSAKPAELPRVVPAEPVLAPEEEGRRFLDFLLEREAVQLEDEADPDELAVGVARLLQQPGGLEMRARALSRWLMAQPQVADLFVDDDDLATLLDQW